jgi:cellulose biosynthesis protein BcsQ
MRKLLIASPKGGAGKTTAAINLAAVAATAGRRVLLVDADPLSNLSAALALSTRPQARPLQRQRTAVTGLYCPDLLPGLDVLSFQAGSCAWGAHLWKVCRALEMSEKHDRYAWAIIDSPAARAGRLTPLLRRADDVLVMTQAQPLALEMLPPFLACLHDSAAGQAMPHLCGILLRRGAGDHCSGSETMLRQRFGSWLLPAVIPHDRQVYKAALTAEVLVHRSPRTPAAVAFRAVADTLGLLASAPSRRLAATPTAVHRVTTAVSLQPPAPTRPAEMAPPLDAPLLPSVFPESVVVVLGSREPE